MIFYKRLYRTRYGKKNRGKQWKKTELHLPVTIFVKELLCRHTWHTHEEAGHREVLTAESFQGSWASELEQLFPPPKQLCTLGLRVHTLSASTAAEVNPALLEDLETLLLGVQVSDLVYEWEYDTETQICPSSYS